MAFETGDFLVANPFHEFDVASAPGHKDVSVQMRMKLTAVLSAVDNNQINVQIYTTGSH